MRRRIACGKGLVSPFVGKGILAVVHGIMLGGVRCRWGRR